MKKTFLIALAGIMMFAFTQCGGGKDSKTTKGSKEYQETMEMYEKLEKAVKDANTCDELQEAALGVLFSGLASKDYADEEKMTEQEEVKLEEYIEKLSDVVEKKAEKLGCDDD